MKLGIFAKTFRCRTLDETLDAVTAHDLRQVQFNLVCAGVQTLPDRIAPALRTQIREGFRLRGLNMAALSGTFNMIHPDPAQRQDAFARFQVLAEAAPELGTEVITLCTGTRNPQNMWVAHPENDSEEAWNDLLYSMEEAVRIAENTGVTLAVEPEVTNVVSSAVKARKLLDHFGSPRLKIVIDPANLIPAGELPRMCEIMAEAFQLLGKDIIIAHAKDLNHGGDAGHEAAGTGVLDYEYYIEQLRQLNYGGPLILHSLTENQVEGSARFLKKMLSTSGADGGGP